eukprot:6185094-Pleurochrysis_carterae.AAC.3
MGGALKPVASCPVAVARDHRRLDRDRHGRPMVRRPHHHPRCSHHNPLFRAKTPPSRQNPSIPPKPLLHVEPPFASTPFSRHSTTFVKTP